MRYPLGASIWLGGAADPATGEPQPLQIRDATGALVDATSITFTMIKPDGTTTVNYSSPTHDGTGLYHQIVPPTDTTVIGPYVWYVTVVVAGLTGILPHGAFDVYAVAEKTLLTIDEVRAQLGYSVTETADDNELRGYIDGITAAAESYKNEIIVQRSFTDVLDLSGYRKFWLRNIPAISLTSVTSLDDGTVYPTSGMNLTGSSGRVTMLRNSSSVYPYGLCSIVYVAGYATIPENYRRGALVMLQDAWSTQRGGSLQPAFGGEVTDVQTSFVVSRRAQEWFGPPRAMVA